MYDLPRLRITRLRRHSGTFRKSTISLNQFREQYNLVTRKKGGAKLDHSIWSVGIRGKMIAVREADRIFAEGMFNIRCNIPYSDFTFGKICEKARSSFILDENILYLLPRIVFIRTTESFASGSYYNAMTLPYTWQWRSRSNSLLYIPVSMRNWNLIEMLNVKKNLPFQRYDLWT